MAPLPQNNTARLFFDYRTGSEAIAREHTIQMRTSATLSTAVDQEDVFLNMLVTIGAGNFHLGWSVFGVRYQAAGSNFSVPIAIDGALADFIGTSDPEGWDEQREALEWTFQGRSFSSGRRVDFSLYGIAVAAPPDFRYTGSEVAWVADTVAYLNSGAVGGNFRAIDGTQPVYYNYVNTNYNSYWERDIRRG